MVSLTVFWPTWLTAMGSTLLHWIVREQAIIHTSMVDSQNDISGDTLKNEVSQSSGLLPCTVDLAEIAGVELFRQLIT